MSSLDLNTSFGALLLGTIISSMLYGAMCLQAWHYFQNYSDGRLIKSAVAALVVLESLHSALIIQVIYYYLILNYFNPVALLKATWSAAVIIIVTHSIRIIVDIFYVWRIYIVSQRNAPLAIIIAVLELAALGTALFASALVLTELWVDFFILPKIAVPTDISLGLSAAVDILVAGSLSFYLRTRKTGISSTDRIVDKLVVHAVNNGVVTSIASMLCLVLARAERTNMLNLMIYLCIGNLYSNTMLSTLNTRRHKSNKHILPASIELSGLYVSGSRTTVASSSLATTTVKTTQENLDTGIEINIQTVVT